MGAARKHEETRADKIIRFVEDYLRVPEGTHGDRPIVLREWQRHLIREIYDSPVPVRRAIISVARTVRRR